MIKGPVIALPMDNELERVGAVLSELAVDAAVTSVVVEPHLVVHVDGEVVLAVNVKHMQPMETQPAF